MGPSGEFPQEDGKNFVAGQGEQTTTTLDAVVALAGVQDTRDYAAELRYLEEHGF